MDRRSYTTCYCVLSFLKKRYVLRTGGYIQHNNQNKKLCLQIELDSNLINSYNYLFVRGFRPARELFSLRGPVRLAPIAERLAVEVSLSLLTIQFYRGFEYPTFRLRGERSNPLRHLCSFHLIKNGYNCIIDFIIFTFFISSANWVLRKQIITFFLRCTMTRT